MTLWVVYYHLRHVWPVILDFLSKPALKCCIWIAFWSLVFVNHIASFVLHLYFAVVWNTDFRFYHKLLLVALSWICFNHSDLLLNLLNLAVLPSLYCCNTVRLWPFVFTMLKLVTISSCWLHLSYWFVTLLFHLNFVELETAPCICCD